MSTTVPQQPVPAPFPPAVPAAPSTASTAPWVVAVLVVLCAVIFMGLCGTAAVIAWLRPGAATPITVMATVMGPLGTLLTPFITVALMNRRR
ncbi:hypothetical protein OG795_33755 (plasmid) [[Kitasatospora] papulosa]|uniref:hypothetical protein n=1 Tax=[Kitasatospora] papulosa TaxID=1464011 RepID=UPI00324654FA